MAKLVRKQSVKAHGPLVRYFVNGHTDRQTDRVTDRQTDKRKLRNPAMPCKAWALLKMYTRTQ